MTASLRALIDGIGQVLKAPLLILAVILLTFIAIAPFGVMLRTTLEDALANQAPIDLGAGEIDGDWWNEFRQHAEGLASTFTPTVIGFAAPLDNLSSLLDGTRRPLALLAPAAVSLVVWALLWGAALQRFDARRGLSLRGSVSAAFSNLPHFVVISLVALAAQLVLYLTLHPLLFDVLYPALSSTASEPAAFAIRVGLYLVFGVPLAIVSLIADYSRVIRIVARPAGMAAMMTEAAGFVWQRLATVATLYVMTGLLFVVLMTSYGVIDIVGGTRVGGWRGVAIGQAFIVGRLMVRLIFGASEISLFKSLRR